MCFTLEARVCRLWRKNPAEADARSLMRQAFLNNDTAAAFDLLWDSALPTWALLEEIYFWSSWECPRPPGCRLKCVLR